MRYKTLAILLVIFMKITVFADNSNSKGVEMEFNISFEPAFAEPLEHGKAVHYGWEVNVIRRVSERYGCNPYEKVKETDVPLLGEGYYVGVSLEERQGHSPEGGKLRDIFASKRLPLRFERECQAWGCWWYDIAKVVALEPFQQELKEGQDITYILRTTVFAPDGEKMAEDTLPFANLPTYTIWDVQLKRPGGIEKIVDGKRILAGARSHVWPGDLLGDGGCGFVYGVGTKHIAAYDSAGNKLWEKNDFAGGDVYNSTSTRVFDINADGKCEVLCMWGTPPDARFQILEGATGKLLNECSWPHNNDDKVRWHHGGNRGHCAYTLDAKIYIANFRGLSSPQDILLQTGDENRPVYTALTSDLEFLWEFDLRAQRAKDGGAGGHCPMIADVDGDGRDEVSAGTYMLNDDGSILWMHPFQPLFGGSGDDHIDNVDIGDIDDDGEMEIAYSNNGVVLKARTGELLWNIQTEHGQWVYITKVRDDLPGKQIIFSEKIGSARLYDSQGKEVEWPFEKIGIPLDWNGDGKADELLTPPPEGIETYCAKIPLFPRNYGLIWDKHGRVIGVTSCGDEICDLLGVGSDSVFTWNLGLNGAVERALSGVPLPQKGTGHSSGDSFFRD